MLERQRPADVHEVLLMDPDTGDILEGASSNVFAIVNGEVWTAEEVGPGRYCSPRHPTRFEPSCF